MIRIDSPHLVPVVELIPGSYATESRQSPDAPIADEREVWARYWSESLGDSGLFGLTAVSPGSWFVFAGQLGISELAVLLKKELSESGIPGVPDADGLVEDCLQEAIGPLSGGYALLDGSEVLLEPSCCGDLGNLAEWQEALRTGSLEWQELWIGHPQLRFRVSQDEVEIEEMQEYEQPRHPRHFSISVEKLSVALQEAAIKQGHFQAKVRESLSLLSPLRDYRGERLHLLARLLVGRAQRQTTIGAWDDYDPGWLVELAKQQHPSLPWLESALAECTQAAWANEAYLHFVDPASANQPGAEWQIDYNLTLNDSEHGELVLDILKGRRVGGIEFLDRLQ